MGSKVLIAALSTALWLAPSARAFAPPTSGRQHIVGSTKTVNRVSTARAFGVDPSLFHDLPQHTDAVRDAILSSSNLLADAVDSVGDAATLIQDPADGVAMTTTAADTASAAAGSASTGNGWFGFLTGPIEGLLKLVHAALVSVGVSQDAWGVSILMMTVVIKILTFPLTKTQLESTTKMQSLQPQLKELQTKYESNPEVMNQKISELYQTNEVNPLAGCVPSFIQIPVFIGLYRAVTTLAKENKLNEPFLFLPSLEGPTYGADPAHGTDWILKGWTDGTPPLGWEDTVAFLILPVFLVVSQFVSMELMQPKTPDGQPQQTNFVLKLLPLMIGWFSLNVPSALCIYWVANNIITTATTLYVRSTLPTQPAMAGGGGATVDTSAPSPFAPSPLREKPAGFGASVFTEEDVNPITPIDAEIVEEDDDFEDDVEDDVEDVVEVAKDQPAAPASGSGMATSPKKKKRSGKRKKKRKN